MLHGGGARVAALVAGSLGVGALALGLAARSEPAPELLPLVVLALCAIVAEWRTTRLPREPGLRVGLTSGVIVVAAIVLGPLGGGLVGLAAALSDGAPPRFRRPVWAGIQVCMGVLAGFAAIAVDGALSDAAADVLAPVAATATTSLANLAGLTVVVLVLRGGVRRVVLPAARLLAVASVAWLPMPIAAVVAYDAFGAAALLIVLVPLVVTEALIAQTRDRAALGREVLDQRVGGALALVHALDARDHVTAAHSAAVAVYAGDLAEAVGLGARAVWRVRLGGLLHDIGKVAVPTRVLWKPGPLDDEEWVLIKEHPVVGESILREIPGAADVLYTVRHHHERPDGRGYPDGLPGERIPREAAIVAVADAYSAMTHTRPYRAAMTPGEAVAELRAVAGVALDGDLVHAFCELLDAQPDAYRRAEGPQFAYGSVAQALGSTEDPAGSGFALRTRTA